MYTLSKLNKILANIHINIHILVYKKIKMYIKKLKLKKINFKM